nr:integrator complex subunit 7 [Vanessa tameamea]
MIGVRLNTFNDSSGEPEQDANSALTELDKGLRSGKVGEQCEAIVRFPRLFEKYPFPILINSSFLKLSDVFRMGNNFLRLWVLRVCQQSEKHLDKILNVDEFLRRVYSVLHSNDPVARALALRTLGAVAGIIPERQNVHHAIRRGLESHDNVEVDAAIYATTRFAAHSNTFAVAMCNKLSDMVECESTGAERRAKLVRALRTVHGGAVRAQGVLKLLRSLLERFPSSSSVRAAITALTAIAADTVVHVPDQVELLLSLAMNDARSAVRRAALLGLKKLAEHAALWPAECIQNLVHAATDTQDPEHTMLCLQVMQILVRCPAVCAAAGSPRGGSPSALRQFCSDAALSVELRQAAIAADVLARIVVHCYEECLPVEGADLMLALESLVIATGLPNGYYNIQPLRIALRCLVKLSTAEPALYAQRTAAVVGAQLCAGGKRQMALLEALAALGALGAPALPHLLPTLEQAKEDCKDPTYDGTTLVLICTVLLQERAGAALTHRINKSWELKIKDAIQEADGWTRYRVARAALRSDIHWPMVMTLKQIAQRYAALARTAFHAHDSTLRHLHISQHTYAQMAQFLDRITSSQQERPESVTKEIKATSLEETIMLAPSVALAKISSKLFDNPTTSSGITHRHAEAILAGVRALAAGACWPRDVCGGGGGGALCRVSLSPAHRPPPAEHAATLPLAHRLALKLEGVVLPAPQGKRKTKRQVKGVQITVTATPHPRTNEKTVELTNIPPVLTAVQTVTPVRDFFSAQQLVSVNAPGLYTVAVEAAFVDERGELWHTGPRTAIVIKAHEDPTTKGNAQTTRGRF